MCNSMNKFGRHFYRNKKRKKNISSLKLHERGLPWGKVPHLTKVLYPIILPKDLAKMMPQLGNIPAQVLQSARCEKEREELSDSHERKMEDAKIGI